MVAVAVLSIVGLYAACGVAFAIAFVTCGVASVDSAAKGSSIAFRLVILPGVAALWPFMLHRWLFAKQDH